MVGLVDGCGSIHRQEHKEYISTKKLQFVAYRRFTDIKFDLYVMSQPSLPSRVKSSVGGRQTQGASPMKAQSEAQQKAAGAALSAKRGETPKSKLQGASKEMYETMTEKELEDMASTKHDKIPERKG